MFSLEQILLSSIVAAIASAAALIAADRQSRSERASLLILSIALGLATLVYRSAANTPALNDDPMPFISPNDVLAPVFAYVTLAVLDGVFPAVRANPRRRALLAIVSLIVNVVTI